MPAPNTDQTRITSRIGQGLPLSRPLPQQISPQIPGQSPQTPSRAEIGVSVAPSQQLHQFQRPQHSPANLIQSVQTRSGLSNHPQSNINNRGADGPSRPHPLEEDGNQGHPDSGPGFVTARGVVNTKGDDATPLPQAPAFNPRNDSPSLRKTNGIDHTKSRPIPREAATGSTMPPINGANEALIPHRANGLNPQLEGIRQIGRPQTNGGSVVNSPLQNRGQFKMPSPAANVATGSKRPAEGTTTGYDPHTFLERHISVQNLQWLIAGHIPEIGQGLL